MERSAMERLWRAATSFLFGSKRPRDDSDAEAAVAVSAEPFAVSDSPPPKRHCTRRDSTTRTLLHKQSESQGKRLASTALALSGRSNDKRARAAPRVSLSSSRSRHHAPSQHTAPPSWLDAPLPPSLLAAGERSGRGSDGLVWEDAGVALEGESRLQQPLNVLPDVFGDDADEPSDGLAKQIEDAIAIKAPLYRLGRTVLESDPRAFLDIATVVNYQLATLPAQGHTPRTTSLHEQLRETSRLREAELKQLQATTTQLRSAFEAHHHSRSELQEELGAQSVAVHLDSLFFELTAKHSDLRDRAQQVCNECDALALTVVELEAEMDTTRLAVERLAPPPELDEDPQRPGAAQFAHLKARDTRLKTKACDLIHRFQATIAALKDEERGVQALQADFAGFAQRNRAHLAPTTYARLGTSGYEFETLLQCLRRQRGGLESGVEKCKALAESFVVGQCVKFVDEKWDLALKLCLQRKLDTNHSRPLTPDEEREWEQAMSGGRGQVLVDHLGVQLKRDKFVCLRDLQWLENDVINMYLKAVEQFVNGWVERAVGRVPARSCHMFSSFFYTRLVRDGYDYVAVRRWTRMVDLFALELLLVPIHTVNHWTLAAIDLTNHRISYYDSLGGMQLHTLQNLRRYLGDEHKHKKKRDRDFSSFTLHHAPCPQQDNGSDCGVFMCKIAEYLACGRDLTFDASHMPFFRKQMGLTVLSGAFDPVPANLKALCDPK